MLFTIVNFAHMKEKLKTAALEISKCLEIEKSVYLAMYRKTRRSEEGLKVLAKMEALQRALTEIHEVAHYLAKEQNKTA